jgi:hypothetical protein
MRKSPRPIVTLLISKESPLMEGRLPVNAEETERGTLIKVDPVSYGALLASIGRFITLETAAQVLIDAAREASLSPSSREAGEPEARRAE